MMTRPLKIAATIVALDIALTPVTVMAQDIDIFTGAAGSGGNANVLIILDNTSNWSATNQGWSPQGTTQGQAEINALKQVIANVSDDINLGLMLLTTVSGNPGGVVTFAMRPMTEANKTVWINRMNTIYSKVQDPTWKASSNANYGAVMFDAFKYFGGYTSPAHAMDNVAGTPVARDRFGTQHYADIDQSIADPAAYDATFTFYNPPTTSDCSKNYIIFIGNGFPNSDSASLLSNVGGDTTPINPNPMDTGSSVYTADEWARFLYATDVSSATGRQNVVTYTVNVYGPNYGPKDGPIPHVQGYYLDNMARAGGANACAATSAADIISCLEKAFADIQGVNDTFTSASLPVNATNRAQNENQVFIGMFRPDSRARPRWMGNMKRYQLVNSGGGVDLGDANGNLAVNPLTGFINPCAISFWTTDSGPSRPTYWNWPGVTTPPGTCPPSITPYSIYNDAPDGPVVEKGSTAEVVRKGNNPPATNTSPTWSVNRTVKTLSGALVDFNATSSGLTTSVTCPDLTSVPNVANWVLGYDVCDENNNGNTAEPRPSIHGDVIHSRPLPVNYGSSGITVYYGANDGMLRAIDASTGKERWSFVAPEHFSKLQRLANNSPLVSFPNVPSSITPAPLPKDYFFDGSIGLFQNLDNTAVWIFPVMRRGGRMVYAFDVTNPDSPVFLWKKGCPSLDNDTGCSAALSGIGQTWSTPNVAYIKGYSTTDPVVIVGGGYDACEDANTSSPACGSTKGNHVYVFRANDGTLIRSFDTARAVAADVSLIDLDSDGMPDFAYAVDTGGNIYRIDFSDGTQNFAPLNSTGWSIHRVAYTNGSGRKFLFAPALLAGSGGNVYVAVGSGDREHPLMTDYPYSSVTNRFYVYLDNVSQTTATNLDDTSVMTNYTTNPTCDSPGTLPDSPYKGWFMDLNQNGQGEQTVTSALIAGGMITFSTNRPVASVNTCSANLGEARGYWVNLFNGSGAIGVKGACGGSRSSIYVGGGLPPSPVLGTVPIGGVPTTVILGAPQKDGSPSSPISPGKVPVPISSKRTMIFWKASGDN
jgi:type IV pilus assembly protein PilY1